MQFACDADPLALVVGDRCVVVSLGLIPKRFDENNFAIIENDDRPVRHECLLLCIELIQFVDTNDRAYLVERSFDFGTR